MQSVKLHSHVGRDGILKLEVPVGLSEVDLEVMVIMPTWGLLLRE